MADERSAATMIQEIEFAPDSPLEESGFEPSVPLLRKGLPGVAEGRFRNDWLGPVLSSGPLARWRLAAGALSVAVPYTARPRFRISFARERYCRHLGLVADLGDEEGHERCYEDAALRHPACPTSMPRAP